MPPGADPTPSGFFLLTSMSLYLCAAVYQAELDFQDQGLFGLIPEKRGPRRAHKLTPQVLEYVGQLRSEPPSLGIAQVGVAILEHFGITVHPRSIERALARQEKKRR